MALTPDPAQAGPDAYLARGWRTDGVLRPELTGLNAFGTALRFQRADLPPDQLATVLESIRQTLPAAKGAPQARLVAAIETGLEMTESILGKPNSSTLEEWLVGCAEHVETDDDLGAFMEHLEAVLRQYAALVAAVTGNAEPE